MDFWKYACRFGCTKDEITNYCVSFMTSHGASWVCLEIGYPSSGISSFSPLKLPHNWGGNPLLWTTPFITLLLSYSPSNIPIIYIYIINTATYHHKMAGFIIFRPCLGWYQFTSNYGWLAYIVITHTHIYIYIYLYNIPWYIPMTSHQ